MKRFFLFLFSACTLLQCSDDSQQLMICGPACSTLATVRDITGLDACHGFVFQLEDGTQLRPYITFYCGTMPIPEEIQNDPLYDFEFVEGKRVMLDYQILNTDFADACMAGQYARITCLSEIDVVSEDTR